MNDSSQLLPALSSTIPLRSQRNTT